MRGLPLSAYKCTDKMYICAEVGMCYIYQMKTLKGTNTYTVSEANYYFKLFCLFGWYSKYINFSDMCTQRIFRSACAFAQCDQNLH